MLVVDDDPDKSEMLKFALAMEGYEVHTVTNGREALSAIESFQPDLIVSDIMMPEVNGYELARRIRENPLTRYIPIILQSAARIEAQDFLLGEEVGALGFITDTSDLGLLLARSRTLLDFRAHLETCEEAAFTDHLTGLANRRASTNNWSEKSNALKGMVIRSAFCCSILTTSRKLTIRLGTKRVTRVITTWPKYCTTGSALRIL